jgi:hypothetical protein
VVGEHDVADAGKFRDVYKIFVGSLKGKQPLGGARGNDNFKNGKAWTVLR